MNLCCLTGQVLNQIGRMNSWKMNEMCLVEGIKVIYMPTDGMWVAATTSGLLFNEIYWEWRYLRILEWPQLGFSPY